MFAQFYLPDNFKRFLLSVIVACATMRMCVCVRERERERSKMSFEN